MKPGLGARRCVRCGKKIEGEESRLLNACPFCGLPFGGTGAPSFTPSPGSYAPPPVQPAAYQQYQPPPVYGAPPAYGYQPSPVRQKSGGGGLVWLLVIGLFVVGAGVGGAVLLQLRSRPSAAFTPISAGGVTSEPTTATPSPDESAHAADPSKPVTKPTTPTAPTTPLIVGTPRPPPSSSSALNNPTVPSSTAALPVVPVTATPTTGTCKATITLTSFNPSTRTCSFNTTANQTPGTLVFPCSGGGSATGTFGKQTFRGSITNGNFTLSNLDPFVFGGCNVQSTQTIFGQVSSGTGNYTYSEQETGGSCGGVSTCRASARVVTTAPTASTGLGF
jgi:hypothetical protein